MAAAGAAGNGVRGKLQQTASSVKSALTIQPRVVPAADETSLTFNPGPLEPDLFVAAAAVMEQQNRNAEAVKKYQEALALDANHREALVGLARLKHREGDLAGALETYQRALQAHPQDAVLLNDVGLCYARAGQSDNALAMLQQAVQLKPESTLYRNNMAAVLVEANRSADAVALLAPTYGTAVAYYNVGYLLQQRNESQAAVEHFAAALDANPSLEPARLMLNRLAPQMAQRPDAVTVPAASRLPATSAPGASAPGRSPAMQGGEPSAAVPARPVVYAETAAAYQLLPPFAADCGSRCRRARFARGATGCCSGGVGRSRSNTRGERTSRRSSRSRSRSRSRHDRACRDPAAGRHRASSQARSAGATGTPIGDCSRELRTCCLLRRTPGTNDASAGRCGGRNRRPLYCEPASMQRARPCITRGATSGPQLLTSPYCGLLRP